MLTHAALKSKHFLEKVNCCGGGRARTDDLWNQNPLFYH